MAKRTRAVGSEPFNTLKCPGGWAPAWLKPWAASHWEPSSCPLRKWVGGTGFAETVHLRES